MQEILVIATLLKHAERLVSELVSVVQRHVHTVTLSMSVQAVFLALLDRIHQLQQQLNQFLFVRHVLLGNILAMAHLLVYLVLLVSIQLAHLQVVHLSLIVLFVLLVIQVLY